MINNCHSHLIFRVRVKRLMNEVKDLSMIWIFSGAGSRFPSGVFLDKCAAIKWVSKHKLTGVLTLYPVNQGVYDWAIEADLFKPCKEREKTAMFIQQFTSVSQEHYHFEDGLLE